MRFLLAILILCALSTLAAAQKPAPASPAKGAFDKSTLEAYLRHVDIYRGPVTFQIGDPKPSRDLPGFSEVTVQLTFQGGSSKEDLYYISPDGQTIVHGDIYNIHKSPFQANLDKLTIKNEPSFGPANAPVTIVEFGDLECPDCRMEAPLLRQNVPETYNGKVRVIFKNYPLESVYRQGESNFWKFYDWIYSTQDQLTPDNLNAKIVEWAGQSGLNGAQLGQCIETKATETEINQSIAEGHALGLRGTPTLFINGRKIGGLEWPDLQLVINTELEYLGAK